MNEEDQEIARKAEAKFEEAIEEFINTFKDSPGLLVDWALITAEHIDHGNGYSSTAHGLFGPKHQRNYNALGLAEYAVLKIKNAFRFPE